MEWLHRFFGATCFVNGHIAVSLSVHNDSGHMHAICARCGSDIVFDGEGWRRTSLRGVATGEDVKLS